MMMVARLAALFMLLLACCPALARGNEVCYTPTLAVKEEYNSNIMLVPEWESATKDFITTVSPGFEISDRSERLDSLILLQLDRLEYAKHMDLSATNQQYSASVKYAATERLTFRAAAGYQKNHNLSFNTGSWSLPSSSEGIGSEINTNTTTTIDNNPPPPPPPPPTPDASNTGVGGTGPAIMLPFISFPLTALTVENITSSVAADYQLTEKTALNAQYQYSGNAYQSPWYHDKSNEGQVGFVTDLSKYLPRLKGNMNAGYGQYLVPGSRTINVTASMGFSYDVSETWSLVADGGLRRTESEVFSANGRDDSAVWGWVGDLSLGYNLENAGAQIQYSRALTLASGLQAATELNALTLSTRFQLTRELSFLLDAGYGMYRSDPALDAANVIRQNSLSLAPRIRYDLSRMSGERDLALEASYERTSIDYLAAHTKANRDLYFIRLSSRFPYCSSSQYK